MAHHFINSMIIAKRPAKPGKKALQTLNPILDEFIINFSNKPSVVLTEASTAEILSEFVREDETPNAYVSMFHSLVSGGNFGVQMATLVENWSRPVSVEEASLSVLLRVANLWLNDYARLHINLIPADLRSALVSFDGQEVGEVSQNTTFTITQSPGFVHHMSAYGRSPSLVCPW